MKLTPVVNFTNILRAHLYQYSCAENSSNLKCKYKKLRAKLLYKKGAHKILVKLTPGFTAEEASDVQEIGHFANC
jgi:hypothetical protein